MVMSVALSKVSPEFNLYEDASFGMIKKVSNKNIIRRQDSKNYYYANGSMYLINCKKTDINLSKMKKIKKIVMNYTNSIDLDDNFDWEIAEMLLRKS